MRPDLATRLEPTFTGWIGHENPFGFEIGATRYTPTIYRFTQGTPNIPALKVAQPGLKIIREVGVENIRKKSKCQTALLMDLASQRGWRAQHAAQSGTPRRHRLHRHAERAAGLQGVAEARHPSRLPSQGGRALLAAFLQQRQEITSAISTVEKILSEMKVGA